MNKRIIVSNADQFKTGKTAMMITATVKDRARIGNNWINGSDCQIGQTVDEVHHFEGYSTIKDDHLIAVDDVGRNRSHLQVESIELVQTADLSESAVKALGYQSFDDMLRHEPGYADRRAWYVRVKVLTTAWWRFW